MALKKCKECGKEMSSKAAACPHCGYKPRKTSMIAWLALIIVIVSVYSGIQGSIDRQREQEKAAQAESARVAKLTPQQRAAEAAAKQRAEAAKAAQEKHEHEIFAKALIGAKLLKRSMKNPDAFKLESALVIDRTNAVCYSYHSTNSFNAVVPGHAVLSHNGKHFLTSDDEGFFHLWNAECANKRGSDEASSINWAGL